MDKINYNLAVSQLLETAVYIHKSKHLSYRTSLDWYKLHYFSSASSGSRLKKHFLSFSLARMKLSILVAIFLTGSALVSSPMGSGNTPFLLFL